MSGNLFIVWAPSGAGKSSLIAALLERDKNVRQSVSFTTRAPRAGEIEGKHYHFVTPAVFQAMIEDGDFLEHAEVYGNFYGTSKKWIDEAMQNGFDVVMAIDWQGAQQIHRIFPQTVGVFILPPSLDVLRQRLTARGQDSAEVIERRLASAHDDMSHLGEFDYVIINNEFIEAVSDLLAIFRSQRLRRDAQFKRNNGIISKLIKR
ncbi:MAG: guanylate kinase [Burkholderiales bacterium]